MVSKLLSIITVTKNCVHTIERTLQSVKAAKTSQAEYIVVDGLSDDGTVEIIERYSDIIDHFVCEPDAGIYNAMNKGVVRARGEFVLFINGDDELIPYGVTETQNVLPECQAQIVCAVTMVVSDGTVPPFLYLPNPNRLVYGNSLPHPSSFIKRELLVQFPFREDLKIASDYDFFLKTYLSGIAFKVVPYQSARHYLGGVSSDNKKRVSEVNLVLRQCLGWRRTYWYKTINILNKGIAKSLALLKTIFRIFHRPRKQ
jgi:glycosyltransferase involved in cell wall biosynthesis